MSRNGHPRVVVPVPLGAVVVGSIAMELGQRFDAHSHPVHQLAWCESGVLAVGVGDATWIVPPSRAVWIPANVVHQIEIAKSALMRSVYFRPRGCPIRWKEPAAVAVSPLLRELIRHLAGDVAEDVRRHAHALLLATITRVSVATVELPMPSDERARRIADRLLVHPAEPRALGALAKSAGASPRTIARAFVEGTGLTFGQWRRQLRMRAAMGQLAEGKSVAEVAAASGYESTSAFVAAFRKSVGVTPARYFAGD